LSFFHVRTIYDLQCVIYGAVCLDLGINGL
jgi:hypothetical protein